MVHHQDAGPTVPPLHVARAEPPSTAWIGWIAFAGIVMLLLGSVNAVQGIVALFNDEYYLVSASGLLVAVDYSTWGWTLLIYGVIVGGTGIGVLFGWMWARVVGVILAGLNALVNLAFVAAYPLWSMLIIVLDVVVIYALVVHGREVRSAV